MPLPSWLPKRPKTGAAAAARIRASATSWSCETPAPSTYIWAKRIAEFAAQAGDAFLDVAEGQLVQVFDPHALAEGLHLLAHDTHPEALDRRIAAHHGDRRRRGQHLKDMGEQAGNVQGDHRPGIARPEFDAPHDALFGNGEHHGRARKQPAAVQAVKPCRRRTDRDHEIRRVRPEAGAQKRHEGIGVPGWIEPGAVEGRVVEGHRSLQALGQIVSELRREDFVGRVLPAERVDDQDLYRSRSVGGVGGVGGRQGRQTSDADGEP